MKLDVTVSINRNAFAWGNDSSAAVSKFWELEQKREEIFSEQKVKDMVSFYTEDVVKNVYELQCIIEKNHGKLDVNISMFIEGVNACHRISFYMNDYEERKKGLAGIAKAKQNLKYILYQEAYNMTKQRKAC